MIPASYMVLKYVPTINTTVVYILGVILIEELFSQFFDIFFAQFFNLPYFPDFFPKCVKFNELDFFASGEFHE